MAFGREKIQEAEDEDARIRDIEKVKKYRCFVRYAYSAGGCGV